jgi:hypothetical protein
VSVRWGAHKECSNCQMVPEIGRESDGSHVFVDYSHLFVDRTISSVPERLVHIAALQLCADKRHYVNSTQVLRIWLLANAFRHQVAE